jgi:tRNA G46 methylase TrmB
MPLHRKFPLKRLVNDSFANCLGWKLHYPAIADSARIVKFVDVGMGFGGLTVALAELFPEKLVLGMEIRAKVSIVILHTCPFQKKTEQSHIMSSSSIWRSVSMCA